MGAYADPVKHLQDIEMNCLRCRMVGFFKSPYRMLFIIVDVLL